MDRRGTPVAVGILLLGLASCQRSEVGQGPTVGQVAQQTRNVESDAALFTVARVIDGDTITVVPSRGSDPLTIRLIGVDTPETVHPTKTVEPFGHAASAFTKGLLNEGQQVRLEYEGESPAKDMYGRTLAYVYRARDGLDVNREIIRQGYGHAYVEFPFRKMERFRAAERLAREDGRGLWSVQKLAVQPSVQQAIPPPRTAQQDQNASNVTVYTTRTGSKYHRNGCRYLSRSKLPTTLAQAKRSLGPCSVCRPPRKP